MRKNINSLKTSAYVLINKGYQLSINQSPGFSGSNSLTRSVINRLTLINQLLRS